MRSALGEPRRPGRARHPGVGRDVGFGFTSKDEQPPLPRSSGSRPGRSRRARRCARKARVNLREPRGDFRRRVGGADRGDLRVRGVRRVPLRLVGAEPPAGIPVYKAPRGGATGEVRPVPLPSTPTLNSRPSTNSSTRASCRNPSLSQFTCRRKPARSGDDAFLGDPGRAVLVCRFTTSGYESPGSPEGSRV